MDRVKINFPKISHHSVTIPILIQHINYGNHVGNDSVVSLLHHARVSFLQAFDYSELDVGGVGLIMADLQVQYKQQMFLNDVIRIDVAVLDLTATGFSLYYKILKIVAKTETVCVLGKTNMLCFDYAMQKIAGLPDTFSLQFRGE